MFFNSHPCHHHHTISGYLVPVGCNPPLKPILALPLSLSPSLLLLLSWALPCPFTLVFSVPIVPQVCGTQFPTRVQMPQNSLSWHHQSCQWIQGWGALSGDDWMSTAEWWPTFSCSPLFPLSLLLSQSTLSSCLYFPFCLHHYVAPCPGGARHGVQWPSTLHSAWWYLSSASCSTT